MLWLVDFKFLKLTLKNVSFQPMSHKCWLHSSQSLGADTLSNLHNTYKASLNTPSIYVCSCLVVILFSLSFNPTLAWNSTITNLIEKTHRQQIWFSQLTENMKYRTHTNPTLPKICTSWATFIPISHSNQESRDVGHNTGLGETGKAG